MIEEEEGDERGKERQRNKETERERDFQISLLDRFSQQEMGTKKYKTSKIGKMNPEITFIFDTHMLLQLLYE